MSATVEAEAISGTNVRRWREKNPVNPFSYWVPTAPAPEAIPGREQRARGGWTHFGARFMLRIFFCTENQVFCAFQSQ